MENKNKQNSDDKNNDELHVNNTEDWSKILSNWFANKVVGARDKADTVFSSDDDVSMSSHIILFVITAFFVIFIFWANFATLDEVTRGDGKIIPSSEIQVLQSLEGGIIEEFMIKEGDEVKANQPLIRLRDVQAASDLGTNLSKYQALSVKATRLRAEAEGLSDIDFDDDLLQKSPKAVSEEIEAFKANMKNLKNQLQVLEQQEAQRRQEVKELNTKIRDLRGVIKLSKEEMEIIRPLVERGSAPKVELLQLERGIKEKQTEINSLTSSLPRVKSSAKEARARIDELISSHKADAQKELTATLSEMASLKETMSALEDRKIRTEIKSPVNGTVKDIKINTVGGVVKSGEGLIEIVPKDDQLLVEARIRPSDIAFIYPGQEAVVKITAYDFSIYGGLRGEVVDISADTITNEKGESFYRIKIRTFENSLKRKGEILPIIPGMVASIDILTGEKTVMEYILKPFIKTLDRAMNER